MDNVHLFEPLNAAPGLARRPSFPLAVLPAKWLIVAVPIVLAWAWRCSSF